MKSSSTSSGLRVPPRRFGRGRIRFFRWVERLCAGLGGRALYRRKYLRSGRFRIREERVVWSALDPAWEGFCVVQLSDLHAGAFLQEGDLVDVVVQVAKLRPDAVVLTGDFVTHHWSEAQGLVADLARLEASEGVYAVFGNHDYKDRAEGRIEELLAPGGVRFLRNQHVLWQRGSAKLALVGLEDLEEGKVVDLAAARAGLDPQVPWMVLCHNPRGAPALLGEGARLVLSGHTHGTQVDLPWLRTLGPQHPGLRVEFGAERTLVVSTGLGVVGVPLRWGAPSEIVCLRLTRGEELHGR